MRTFSQIVAIAVLLAACIEPVQYGGPIPIDTAGLEARLESLCMLTGQTSRCAAAFAAPEPASGH